MKNTIINLSINNARNNLNEKYKHKIIIKLLFF